MFQDISFHSSSSVALQCNAINRAGNVHRDNNPRNVRRHPDLWWVPILTTPAGMQLLFFFRDTEMVTLLSKQVFKTNHIVREMTNHTNEFRYLLGFWIKAPQCNGWMVNTNARPYALLIHLILHPFAYFRTVCSNFQTSTFRASPLTTQCHCSRY